MTESRGSKLNCFHWQLFATAVDSKQTHESAAKYKINFILAKYTSYETGGMKTTTSAGGQGRWA